MNLKLVLMDLTEIPLTNGNFIENFSTVCKTKEDILYMWSKLNPDNTQQVKVYLGSDLIQTIYNVHVEGMQIQEDKNNDQYLVTFRFYGASYMIDKINDYTDAARILLGEDD